MIDKYKKQVELLIDILLEIAKENDFAINIPQIQPINATFGVRKRRK